jgi:hypothetical protein
VASIARVLAATESWPDMETQYNLLLTDAALLHEMLVDFEEVNNEKIERALQQPGAFSLASITKEHRNQLEALRRAMAGNLVIDLPGMVTNTGELHAIGHHAVDAAVWRYIPKAERGMMRRADVEATKEPLMARGLIDLKGRLPHKVRLKLSKEGAL